MTEVAKPRRRGAWVKIGWPRYNPVSGWYQVWEYTANPHRYELEDLFDPPPHITKEDMDNGKVS